LLDHIGDLPTPEPKSLSLENAVPLSNLVYNSLENGLQEVSDKLQDMAVGILQLIEDPAWNKN
jgi:hypothetical protein